MSEGLFSWRKVPKPFQRRLARWLGCRACSIRPATPLVSFTFDDFPRSALLQGGSILREHGFLGTFYTSFGQMGQNSPVGEIFSSRDFSEFLGQGHEFGCHTFNHCDSWDTAPSEFEASILRNRQMIAREFPSSAMSSLSYPISYPRPQTKHRVAKYYGCARGGGQTINFGRTDLNYLKAFFIEQSRDDFDSIKRVIDLNAYESGWLIFATHDVCSSPTRFGCTPLLFQRVVQEAVKSGARVLPVSKALQVCSEIANGCSVS